MNSILKLNNMDMQPKNQKNTSKEKNGFINLESE